MAQAQGGRGRGFLLWGKAFSVRVDFSSFVLTLVYYIVCKVVLDRLDF